MKRTDLNHYGAFILTQCTPQEAKAEVPDGWNALAIYVQGEGKIGFAIFNPVHELPMHSARDREIIAEKMLHLYEAATTNNKE